MHRHVPHTPFINSNFLAKSKYFCFPFLGQGHQGQGHLHTLHIPQVALRTVAPLHLVQGKHGHKFIKSLEIAFYL